MGGGAWPLLVGGVICLVDSVNERDLDPLIGAVVDCRVVVPGVGSRLCFGPWLETGRITS